MSAFPEVPVLEGRLVRLEAFARFRNRQPRAAPERPGAKQDGVLRSRKVWRDGTLRDTVVCPILAIE